jgi:hypothetical protein
MIPEDRLRLSHDEAADTAWAIGSTEVYLLLCTRRGWTTNQFEAWLTRTLIRDLLTDFR